MISCKLDEELNEYFIANGLVQTAECFNKEHKYLKTKKPVCNDMKSSSTAINGNFKGQPRLVKRFIKLEHQKEKYECSLKQIKKRLTCFEKNLVNQDRFITKFDDICQNHLKFNLSMIDNLENMVRKLYLVNAVNKDLEKWSFNNQQEALNMKLKSFSTSDLNARMDPRILFLGGKVSNGLWRQWEIDFSSPNLTAISNNFQLLASWSPVGIADKKIKSLINLHEDSTRIASYGSERQNIVNQDFIKANYQKKNEVTRDICCNDPLQETNLQNQIIDEDKISNVEMHTSPVSKSLQEENIDVKSWSSHCNLERFDIKENGKSNIKEPKNIITQSFLLSFNKTDFPEESNAATTKDFCKDDEKPFATKTIKKCKSHKVTDNSSKIAPLENIRINNSDGSLESVRLSHEESNVPSSNNESTNCKKSKMQTILKLGKSHYQNKGKKGKISREGSKI